MSKNISILKNKLFTQSKSKNNIESGTSNIHQKNILKQKSNSIKKSGIRNIAVNDLCQSEKVANILGLTIPYTLTTSNSSNFPTSVRDWFKYLGSKNEQHVLQFFPYKVELTSKQEKIARVICGDIVNFNENTIRILNNNLYLYFKYESDAILVKLSVF